MLAIKTQTEALNICASVSPLINRVSTDFLYLFSAGMQPR